MLTVNHHNLLVPIKIIWYLHNEQMKPLGNILLSFKKWHHEDFQKRFSNVVLVNIEQSSSGKVKPQYQQRVLNHLMPQVPL